MTTGEVKTYRDLSKTSARDHEYNCNKCERARTDETKVFDTKADSVSSSDTRTCFCNIYQALNDENPAVEKLYVKNDLLGTLREILERNVNIKTEMLKYNLNKMLDVNKPQIFEQNEAGANEETGVENLKEFNQDEISFIEQQVDKILLEAQILVSGLLNTSFDCGDRNFGEIGDCGIDFPLKAPGDDSALSKSENLPPPSLDQEHILEAPEGFRSSGPQLGCDSPQKTEPNELSDTEILLAEGLKCHSDAALLVEPERPVVANHGDDNKLTQEVDTYRRAKREEIKTCENDITTTTTIITYEQENHASCRPGGTATDAFTTTDFVGDVNRGNALEKALDEINESKVVDGMRFDLMHECESAVNSEAELKGRNKTDDGDEQTRFERDQKEIMSCSDGNPPFNDSKLNGGKIHAKRKPIHLVVSDTPKSNIFEQCLARKKYKSNPDRNINKERCADNSKSLLNLVVTDKPRKKVSDRILYDMNNGSERRKSDTRYGRNGDNDQNGIIHVGTTITTPTHLLGDTSRENCCIECRNCNESIAIPTSKTIRTATPGSECNSEEIKVDLNEKRQKHDDKHDDTRSPLLNLAVRDVSCCPCAESAAETARDSNMPKSTTATSATVTTSQSSSIETGVERCAESSGCSRESAVSVRVAFDTSSCTFPIITGQDSKGHTENDRHGATTTVRIESDRPATKNREISENNNNNNSNNKQTEHLTWSFKNGRLVFEDAVLSPENERESETATNILTSKELNRKSAEGRQLKLVEQKLKRAGLTDEIKLNFPQNLHQSDDGKRDEENGKGIKDLDDEDLIPEYEHLDFCEFDPNKTNLFDLEHDADFYLVYDELLENEELIVDMRGEGGMGTNVERKQHNPDHDNLKSLLKRPGHGKDAGKKNRVVFNETKNEFFDADYIILIREECDYDDEDDDGICTCNQHEMVRLTCCEPNCNCNAYDGFGDPTPQSPKFAPPLEFVDSVTLSPPEEYKDMELEEQQLMALQQIARRGGQRALVCRECSASHEVEGDGSQSDNEEGVTEVISDHDEIEEKEKTDQSQQTTPTTPPADSDTSINNQHYILETLSMTTVTERQVIKEIEERKSSPTPTVPPGGSPISGILKGGRLWKQSGAEINNQPKVPDLQQIADSNIASDEETGSRRSVRFTEFKEINQRDICDGAAEKVNKEEVKPAENDSSKEQKEEQTNSGNVSASPESTEMMLTFKLGNHVLISNNSLKPNSAVRQLFPCTKPLGAKIGDEDASSVHQYLVTAESLKAFEEAKRSKLPQIIQSGETDDSIRKAIERNTLRRSLIRYEPRSKKPVQKTDNSLVERIKQLTCNVEEDLNQETEEVSQRASPPGEEARNSPEIAINKNQDKSFSPSSSSTTSSNSSSMSSTCRKFTDLFAKREKMPDIQNVNDQTRNNQLAPAPDLGNGTQTLIESPPCSNVKSNPGETKKQFLSTLAPLTACVSGIGPTDDYYHINNHSGERTSIASSVGTEYSLEDIDEVLRKDEEESKKITPDVLAGTPSASESGDELAMFVQQDAGRIERIKKKYQPETTEEDDEHDDYGFNRRPSVRGIKPRFGSTTEILQQIQNQMQPPNNTPPRNHVAWPYYSETNLTGMDNTKSRNINQNLPHYPYPNASVEDIKRSYASHQYRPNTYIEENIYQNCANQRCPQVNYRANANLYPPVVRVGGGCSDYYTSLPRNRNARPQSPPPQEVSKNYHQTMVYIPYNHIEGYHPMSPNPYYSSANDTCYTRVTNQNQINKRYLDPTYQQRLNQPVEDHYQKAILRPGYPAPNHLVSSRSESPIPGQFSTARSTQTPVANVATCTYLPARYRPMIGPVNAMPANGLIWQGEPTYVSKINRHSFPRYPPPDSISLTDSDSQHSGQMPNGYRQPIDSCYNMQKDSMPNSPTKPRFIERGVPEGAASVSPQDSMNTAQNTSTMTSPTSPQNPPPPSTTKPLFYAMNV